MTSWDRSIELSVGLSAQDIAFLDTYARDHGLPSRSAALRHAIRLLRTRELAAAYASEWDMRGSTGEAEEWVVATHDDGQGAARLRVSGR